MRQGRAEQPTRQEPYRAMDDDARVSASLMALAAVLLLLVTSTVVIRKLQVRCMMEACLMSGQPGCEYKADQLRVSRVMDRFWRT